ncbi:MAG: CvpA family protein [Bacteroidales bacterium]|nr:CvpA family protein [Bacteroidales bacterium]
MNLIDIIALIPIAWGVYKGFSKGFISEIAQIAALVLGVLTSFYFSKWVGAYISDFINTNEQQTQLIAFVIVFLCTLALVFLFAHALERFIKNMDIGIVNRLLGSAFACLKYIFILSIIFNFISISDPKGVFVPKSSRDNSLLYKPILKVAHVVLPLLSDTIEKNEIENLNSAE